MSSEFNIYIYSEDVNFSSALALECNKYGFELTFFEDSNMKEIFDKHASFVSVVIIDLGNDYENRKLKLGEKARINSNYPIFGVVNKVPTELPSAISNKVDLLLPEAIIVSVLDLAAIEAAFNFVRIPPRP